MFSLIIRSIRALTREERKIVIIVLVIFALSFSGFELIAYYEHTTIGPATGGLYSEGMVGQPIAVNPVLAGQNSVDRDLIHLVFAPLQTVIQSATPSEDYTTWNIVLKDDLTWSDGNELGAEDIRFTIKTIQDPDTHSPFAGIWSGVTVEIISSR